MEATGTNVQLQLTEEERQKMEEAVQRKFETFMLEIDLLIVDKKHFKNGKINNYAKVEGIKEYQEGCVPFEHQTHYYDKLGRVVKLEKFERDFSKPTVRIYYYEGDSEWVSESVWFDRYNKLDNIHRYKVDPLTGLMIERYEYNSQGEIYYFIRSTYDEGQNLVEESWHDKDGTLLKKHKYTNDENGEIIKEEQFNADGSLSGFFTLTYDSMGNLAEKSWHNSSGRKMSTFLYENADFLKTTKITLLDGEGNLMGTQEFLYDACDNVTEEKAFDRNGKPMKHLKF
jgi:hypothetical protein